MSARIKHFFIYICIFSLFSLTLQASGINLCKESKAFKNQINPLTEDEEEGSHDSDEAADEEVFFIGHNALSYSSEDLLKLTWAVLNINYPRHSKTILVPPPKY
ncbi:MAG: hypothetical protein H7141_10550 [Burkholderiales bacterium]|nr:hypothetical protein [Bacteroidia bacterium]